MKTCLSASATLIALAFAALAACAAEPGQATKSASSAPAAKATETAAKAAATPTTSAKPGPAPDGSLLIEVTNPDAPTIRVGGKTVNAAELKKLIADYRQSVAKGKDFLVILRYDPQVHYAALAQVIEAVANAGIPGWRITIQLESFEEGNAPAATAAPAPSSSAKPAATPTAAAAQNVAEISAALAGQRYDVDVQVSGHTGRALRLQCRPPAAPGDKAFSDPNFIPLMLRLNRLQAEPGDPLKLTIRPEGSDKRYVLYSADATSAVYIINLFLPPSLRAAYLDPIAKEPKDVVAVTGYALLGRDPVRGWAELAADSPEGRAVLPLARQLYDSRRPELARKFHIEESHLFYVPSEKAFWLVYKKDSTVIALCGCNDMMYVATFFFTFEKNKDGRWQCTRIAGGEAFKGE
jgi:biopolymer transport protein ExbD